MLEERVEAHEPAVAPAPDADARGIDVRSLTQRARSDRLIAGLQHAQLAVDRLSPLTAQRCRSAMVVDARHQKSPLGEHQMPQIVSAPGIVPGGRAWTAVHVE